MQIVDGRQMAEKIKARLNRENRLLNLSPTLAVILLGEDEESQAYVSLKQKAAADIGGYCRLISLAADTGAATLLKEIKHLNDDEQIHGIILQLPLPPSLQGQEDEFLAAIRPDKDVDGFNPINRGLLLGGKPLFTSCSTLACLELISLYVPDLNGKRAVMIGDSFDLIWPLSVSLIKQQCEVSIRPVWKAGHPVIADILLVEKGQPGMIRAADLSPGMLVIDAGFYWGPKGAQGNVCLEGVAKLTGSLVPVPGGIGPLLIAKLMENLTKAAKGAKE